MRKYVPLTALALAPLTAVVAQTQTGLVKGRVVSALTNAPATDVQVSLPFLRQLTNTDAEGNFTLSRVPYGDQTLVIGGTTARPDTIRIQVGSDVVVLNDIQVVPNEQATSMRSIQIPTIALEETDGGEDDGAKTSSVSGLLSASRDPFLNAAAFVFGPMRFQPRGYDRNSQQVLINGAPMNDVETNDAYWSQWGGLNDVFRGRSNTYGLQPSEYAYGGLNGTVYFDATAANQRRQTRVTYSASNRQYRNRLMLTHSTGLMKNGWALSVSGSKRWAEEGYIPGTFYDGYSYYLSVSKKFNEQHTLSFTTFGAPTKRGKSAPVFQEAVEITDNSFYNPNWGYLNGEKRNARVANSFQPVFQLTHDWKPSEKTSLLTTFSYQTGKNRNSGIDWYNAPDPRPDYYRNMPLTYQLDNKNPLDAPFYTKQQIDWDNLYQVNYGSVEMLNGEAKKRSIYVIGEDVDDINKFVLSSTLQHVVNDYVRVSGGFSLIKQRTESYRELSDLLGGDFFRNLNQFANFNNNQGSNITSNDVNNPNNVVHVGDRYFYNYINNFNKGWIWGQGQMTFNKVDVFVSANFGLNSFDREGLWRSGLYANGNESYGKSERQNYTLFGAKAGATYKLNGRNYLFANLGIQQDAPTLDNTFISPRIRNYVFPKATEQQAYTFEGGFLHRAPSLNVRAVGYVTDIKNETTLKRFFLETGGANSFVQYVMSGVNTRNIGLELAAEYKISPSFSATGVAALGQAFYTNNPQVDIYLDNFVDSTGRGGYKGSEQVYIKDYYLSVGPQSAYTLGLNYRAPSYWYVNLNANFYDRSYVDIAPTRRTEKSVAGYPPGSADYNRILDQEKLPSAFTMDLFFGKSFLLSRKFKKLPRNTFLYLNAGVSYLLDNTDIRTSGFENLRVDNNGQINRFPSKYFYAFGRNFFVNLSLKF